MTNERLIYFKIAKELNEKHHDFLIQNQLHFRGSLKSFSIISLNQNTPECGISRLKSISQAEKAMHDLKTNGIKSPGRKTEEKNLQAFIINFAMNNNGHLPFGDFTFITSEIAFQLPEGKRIVNDILALDSNNSLAIIELKSLRSNKVKQQTIDFEKKVVLNEMEFFTEFIELMTGKIWNRKTLKVAVWKAPSNKTTIRKNECSEELFNSVQLYNYTFKGLDTENLVIMNEVTFSEE